MGQRSTQMRRNVVEQVLSQLGGYLIINCIELQTADHGALDLDLGSSAAYDGTRAG